MEETMSNELIIGIVLLILQFAFIIAIGLVGYVFKMSIISLKEAIDDLKKENDKETKIRMKENDEIFERLRVIEKEYADRRETKQLIAEAK